MALFGFERMDARKPEEGVMPETNTRTVGFWEPVPAQLTTEQWFGRRRPHAGLCSLQSPLLLDRAVACYWINRMARVRASNVERAA